MSRRSLILDAQFEFERMREEWTVIMEDEDERRRVFDTKRGHINRHHVQLSEMFRSLLAIENDQMGVAA
mgnify:CR=1 FL=1